MVGGVIVAQLCCGCIELREGRAGLEVVFRVGQRFEFLVRCHPVPVAIALDLFTFGIGDCFGKETGPVEVQIRNQVFAVEHIHRGGVMLGNVGVAQRLANRGGVFAFDQGIVIGFARA